MGIISKPTTFVAGTTKSGEASQVNADFDTLYAEFNGNIEDANIKANAAIAQSKIANLVSNLGTAGGVVLLSSQAASNSATIDFTQISATYTNYILTVDSVIPATDNVTLGLRMGTGVGPTYDSGTNYDFAGVSIGTSTALTSIQTTGVSAVTLAAALGNAAGESFQCTTVLYSLGSATLVKCIHSVASWSSAPGELVYISQAGVYRSSTAVTGLRLLHSAGNITSGTFKLFGVKNT